MRGRVLVLGPGGAGKTRVSRRLGVALGLEVLHLDGCGPGESLQWMARRPRCVVDGDALETLHVRAPCAAPVVVLRSRRDVRAFLDALLGT